MAADATSVGQIGLDLVVNKNGFDRQMAGIQGMAKKAGKALAAAFGVKKLVDFSKSCIKLGSDLQEVQNVVDVTFTSMSGKVDKFAKNAASSFGLSETMAKKYTGTFGAMAKAFGFTEKQAYDMSTTLTGLAGDVASFYNISQDEAYTKLKSVFTGETETLKELGVVMTQNALDAYAMANGYGKTTSAMSEAEKVALRYAFVQNQLSAAAGDFSRTSGSWANQVRVLTLQFESLKATIGQGLINVFTPVIRVVNILIGRLLTLANAFNTFTGYFTKFSASGSQTSNATKKISDGFNAANNAVKTLGTSADGTANKVSKAAGKAGKAADKAAKKARSLMGFDQINKLDKKESSSSSGSGGGSGAGGSRIGSGAISAGSIDTGAGEEEKKIKTLPKLYENLAKSITRFKNSCAELGKVIKSGLKWGYENVLKPLGKWTISKFLPKLLDVFSGAIKVLTSVIKALAPLGKWLWDKFLSKLAKFAGNVIIKFLDLFATGLNKLSDWIDKHQGAVQNIAIAMGTFFAVFKAAKFVGKVAGTIKHIGDVISFLGGPIKIAVNAFKVFAGAINWPVVVIGALVAGGIILYKNWDKIKKTKFGKFISGIAKNFKDLYKKIKDNLHPIESFKKAWEAIKDKKAKLEAEAKEKVEGAVDKLKEGWETIQDKAASLVAEAKEKVSGAIESLKDKWETIKDKASTLTAEAKEKANGLIDKLKSGWESIKDKTATLTGEAKNAASSVLSALKSGWDTIVNKTATLTGKAVNATGSVISSIKSAWETVKNKAATLTAKAVSKGKLSSIKKTWDSIKSKTATLSLKFSAMASDLKGWMNKNVISKINGAIHKIPFVPKSWNIPQLAQGGFIKKNTPQLAMIGDNRHQGEVVAPEGKLDAMALKAAQLAAGSGNAEIIALLKQILLFLQTMDTGTYLDGKIIKDNVVNRINNNTKATGKCEIIF